MKFAILILVYMIFLRFYILKKFRIGIISFGNLVSTFIVFLLILFFETNLDYLSKVANFLGFKTASNLILVLGILGLTGLFVSQSILLHKMESKLNKLTKRIALLDLIDDEKYD